MPSCGAHVTAHVTCMCVTCHIIYRVIVVVHDVVHHNVSHMSDVIMRVTSGVSQVIVHVTCCHAIVSCCRAITMCVCVCVRGAAGRDTMHIACDVSNKACVTEHITCRQYVSCTSQVTYRKASCLARESSHTSQGNASQVTHPMSSRVSSVTQITCRHTSCPHVAHMINMSSHM